MTAHAILSASSSKRWISCTPSARLEATLPELKKPAGSFDFSVEGTLAHSLAEIKLRLHYTQITQEQYEQDLQEIQRNKYYTDELADYVDNYVLYVRSQIGESDTPLFEQRVDFSDWVPDGFGTADVVYFLSTPFASSTSSLEKASQSPHKTTHSSDSTPSVRTPSSKKISQNSKKLATQSTNRASKASQQTAQPSPNSSTGRSTSSNQKPRKRGVAQATSSRANGASSAKPKRNAAPARTSTTSSQSSSSKRPHSSAKKK